MTDQIVSALQQGLRGRVIGRGDADYDAVRALYNGMIDKKPRVIARCVDVADVIAAVNLGRDQGLLIAIRGGGHNGPGLGSCDDGLMIDLSLMKSVRVDPQAKTVRVEPGCTSGDVDHATHAFGLAVPFGIVSSTGVAGLTLGGGTGYLTRKYGLTIDNLLEVDMVLADGSFVTASERQHPDLFWAVRGGGGNFGVVTSFLFQAHPVRMVYAGPIFWEATHAKAVMSAYRDFLPTAPEELGIFVGLKTVPPMDPFPKDYWGQRACAIIGSYNGGAADGEKLMARLLDGLPPPIFNWMGEMPFPAIKSLFDPFFPKGLQWYWKGDFVKSLPDEAIEAHIAQAAAGAERPVPDAPVPDRRRRAARREGRDGVERARCDLVDGHRGDRSGPEEGGRAEGLGTRLLEGGPPVQPRGRLRQLHDGRRSGGPRAGDLRRQLRPARGHQGAVRPEESLPREPEHPAGRRLTTPRRRCSASRWGCSSSRPTR